MLDQARASAATVRGHPAQSRVRPFQAFQDAAQAHLVLPAASAQQEPALPLEESAARARRLAVPAAWDAVEAAQLAGPDVEEVPQQEVAVLDVAEGARAGPSAAPWVFRRDQALPWPAPQPAVWFARAMQGLRIALPSAQSWQAVRGEVVS
jgi:hypothetical protein